MKRYERVGVDRERLVEVVCDLCRRTSPSESWVPEVFGKDVVTVSRIFSDTPREAETIREFDLCPDCFEARLVPYLEAAGAEVSETEVEYEQSLDCQ